jgi:hypothetical protein
MYFNKNNKQLLHMRTDSSVNLGKVKISCIFIGPMNCSYNTEYVYYLVIVIVLNSALNVSSHPAPRFVVKNLIAYAFLTSFLYNVTSRNETQLTRIRKTNCLPKVIALVYRD